MQETALLRLSGHHGLYVEPRVPDATVPSDEYQVVWLPQATFPTAQHQLQCEPMGIGLARSGARYGIRVTAAQYQQVFQKLEPDGLFLSPGTRQVWHSGPWPYGCDRKSLSRVFSDWKWQARPLQPAKPINGGLMWLIQSVEDPPNTVYNMQHGQVMISKVDSIREGMTEAGSVAGPQSTVELCATASTQRPMAHQGSMATGLAQSAHASCTKCCHQLARDGGQSGSISVAEVASRPHGSGRHLRPFAPFRDTDAAIDLASAKP